MKKTRNKLLLYFLLVNTLCFAQSGYKYSRPIEDIKEQWQKIVLPDDIFGELNTGLSDMRIYGVTKNNDTIEVPYILQKAIDNIDIKPTIFNLLNQTKTDDGYYFTLENTHTSPTLVNKMILDFRQKNFDWQVKLEGRDGTESKWFSIVDNYRILSIDNESTDFQFTTIDFPTANYRFYRLHIKTNEKPELISASIGLVKKTPGQYQYYKATAVKIDIDKKSKQSIIRIDLPEKVPVCNLQIHVKDTVDYFRRVTVKYITDSVKTEKSWLKNYETLTNTTLSSMEKSRIKFDNTVLKNIYIAIENQDNMPLNIDSVSISGNIYYLIARFGNPDASYSLYYGNDNAKMPVYDIEHFREKIPETLTEVSLGKKIVLKEQPAPITKALFENEWILWSIIILIIITLGWFSLKMLKQK